MKDEIIATRIWKVYEDPDAGEYEQEPDVGKLKYCKTLVRLQDVMDYEEYSYGPLLAEGDQITEVISRISIKYIVCPFKTFHKKMMEYKAQRKATGNVIWNKN